ncbi:MAG: DUF72 domain-containing protein [Verrucomicrobiia bacterium]|jgi:uncharacterized protein YecE (DUF72 family)
MKKEIKVGCCGFGGSQEDYFKKFRIVEVQQTFYDPPQIKTLERWRQNAPDDFEFTIKAWQIITHKFPGPTYRRMRRKYSELELKEAGFFRGSRIVWQGFEETVQCAVALKACAIVFQCPSSFKPTDENIDNFCNFFSKALKILPLELKTTRLVWEARGEWTSDSIKSLCDRFGLIDCVDIFVRKPTTAGEFYFRLHGGEDYSHTYNDTELGWLQEQVQKYEGGFCMFNNVSMITDAQRFLRILGRNY